MMMVRVLMRVENETHVFREVGPKIRCPLLPTSSCDQDLVVLWGGSR